MGLLKTALIGAAVYGAINYITKKDKLTGRSILEDLTDKATEQINKMKDYKEEVVPSLNNPNGTYFE